MGSLFVDDTVVQDIRAKQEEALLHRMGCQVCPLNSYVGGDMKPTGAEDPVVYVLGEAPGKDEVEAQEQFVGESGQLLRPRLPRQWRNRIRWNNTVRTRPPKNRTPTWQETECCRPSVVKDIEATKPRAILGFGNVPLHWVSGFSGVTLWRGRKMPVKVGEHQCWYYPLLHPAYILRARRKQHIGDTEIGSEDERMFVMDLKRAFAEIEDLPPAVVHTPEMVDDGVEVLTTFGREGLNQISAYLGSASRARAIGIDWETKGIRPYTEGAKLLTAAFSWGTKSFSFGIDHREARWTPTERVELLELVGRFLERCAAVKVVHNLAFEQEWTEFFIAKGLLRAGKWEDTSSAAGILDERKGDRKPGCFSLEFLCQQYFGFNLKKLSGVDRQKLDNTPLPKVLRYNARDAKYHLLLWDEQVKQLDRDKLWEPYRLSVRRVPTVVLTQAKGVPVDQAEVTRLSTKYGDRIVDLEAEIRALPVVKEFQQRKGQPFNPLSNPDAVVVFRDMLQRPEVEVVDKYSREKKYSVDESVLDQIAKDEPLATKIIALRKVSKRKSTYVDALAPGTPNTTLYPDGRVHPQFNTVFAETGRLSCEDPNLQNFPKRDAEGREVRRMIVAPPGKIILAFDYGQIEARVIAMFTKDKAFCKALWERYDVHMDWAKRIAAEYPERIGGEKNLDNKKAMKDFRTDIKNQWTFPLFFGASVQSAAGYLDIPEQIIKPLYDEFWEEYAGVKKWQEAQLDLYHEKGYVECLTGRRRRGPLSNQQVFNSPVQGTAAEIVMDAMCRLSETGDPDLQASINIHDDLTYVEVDEERAEAVAEKVIGHMLDVPFSWVNVPITVEAAYGYNWETLKEFGTYSSDKWFKKAA